MKIKKMIMIAGCLMGVCIWQEVYADGFVINLYYSTATKTLKFDEQAAKNIVRDESADTSVVEFSKDTTIGPYILELYNGKGVKFSENQFNKQDDKPFQLIIPYFSTAKRLQIVEKSTGDVLLYADLSEFVTCNGNGLCESHLGETKFNCMGDCTVEASVQKDSLNNTDKSATTSEKQSFGQKILQFFKDLF